MKILFEDVHLVVVSKPAGLLSQGEESGAENLVDKMRKHFGRHYVGLVHRLDRNTSGLMVIAKRTKAADRLTQSLQKGELKRNYVAILCGDLRNECRWSHYLLKDEKENKSQVVSKDREGSKLAVLGVRPLKNLRIKGEAFTLGEFVLETGRSHQIRAQASYEGYPLLGDKKYGAKSQLQFDRPALHSISIEFPHPMTKEVLHFEDSLPDDMNRIISSTLS